MTLWEISRDTCSVIDKSGEVWQGSLGLVGIQSCAPQFLECWVHPIAGLWNNMPSVATASLLQRKTACVSDLCQDIQIAVKVLFDKTVSSCQIILTQLRMLDRAFMHCCFLKTHYLVSQIIGRVYECLIHCTWKISSTLIMCTYRVCNFVTVQDWEEIRKHYENCWS